MCDPVSATIGVIGGLAMTAMQPDIPKPPPVPEVEEAQKKAKKSEARSYESKDVKKGLSSTLLTGNRGLQTKALTQQKTLLGGNTKLGH